MGEKQHLRIAAIPQPLPPVYGLLLFLLLPLPVPKGFRKELWASLPPHILSCWPESLPYNVTLCKVNAALTDRCVSNIHVGLTGSGGGGEAATPGAIPYPPRRPQKRGMLFAAPEASPLFCSLRFPGVASESQQSLWSGSPVTQRVGERQGERQRAREREREAA